jgi:DNA-binding Xre family transcriptional regulator
MKIKNNIFILMAKKEIRTLPQLAKVADVHYKKLYLFANDKQRYIDPEFLGQLCKALDCQLGDLLEFEK